MISDRNNIRRQSIHNLDRRKPFVFRVDDRTAEHVSRDRVQRIRLFFPNALNIAGQHRYSPHQLLVYLFGKKIPMHVI